MAATIKWLGHSAFEIKTGGKTLLVDPFLKDNPMAAIQPEEAQADYVLITHGHYDHIGDVVSIAGRTGATVIANPEISAWCVKQGLKSQAIRIGESSDFPFGKVELTEAVHSSNLKDGSNGGDAAGIIITTTEGRKIYHAGDTGLFDGMKAIGAKGIDFAAIPIGGYYTMDPDESLRAVKVIQPRVVMPIHFNTFDKIRQDPEKWASRVRAETATRVVVLKPGESVEI